MKLIAALFLLPILALANSGSPDDRRIKDVQDDLITFAAANGSETIKAEKVLKFVQLLHDKKGRFSSQTDFLQYMFQQTHRRFLKHYQASTTFDALFEKETYNCLTATALYSVLLDHFDFDFSVVETSYHIFIIANVDGKEVLLETTDPLTGFISDKDEIAGRIEKYKTGEVKVASSEKIYYQYQRVVYNTISKDQLRGLIHYNLSVDAYNEKDLEASTAHFVSAYALHPSSRLEEFSQILQFSISRADMPVEKQTALLKKIQAAQQPTFFALTVQAN